MHTDLKNFILEAFDRRDLLRESVHREKVLSVIELIDEGKVRVAEKVGMEWQVNEWVKKAILLYFGIREIENFDAGPFQYADKIPIKRRIALNGVRVVPGAIVRRASFVAPGAILMPCFINIGAYVGEETMIDTWATVGSCAQIGRRVHLSGGVGIGGVLEPAQAAPVIIEDNVFVGSRAIVVEGVRVQEGAVLGANVVLTASTKIIDATVPGGREYKGIVPPRSVVIPGTRAKEFPGGTFQVPVALIIGQRKQSTDEKTSLNDALREFNVPA